MSEEKKDTMQNIDTYMDFSDDLLYTLNDVNSQISTIRDQNKKAKKNLNYILQHSEKQAKELQELSDLLTSKNGQLRELITYKSSILTYDHYIMPLDVSKYKNKKDLMDARRKASKQVEKYNLKHNCKWITEEVIKYGEVYLALLGGKGNSDYLFFKFPRDMCKMTKKVGSMVSKFAINLSCLNSTNYSKYPAEIQKLYLDYQEGIIDKNRIIDYTWYQMDEVNYMAFSLREWEKKGSPYYSYLFGSLASLEELSDLVNLNAYIDSFRLLHQKPELDNNGQLKMERKKILNYHNSLKTIAPYGYLTLTSPFEIKLLSSDGNSNGILDSREKTKTAIYDASGVNDNLFNGNTTNTEAVSIGFAIDTLLPLRIQKSIENWVNDHMKRIRATSNWFLEFITTNIYNKGLEEERQRNALTVYSPKWKYLATTGLTPLRALSTLESEELDMIENYMRPLSTAYTQSGNESKITTIEGAGRPSNADNGNSNAKSSNNNPNQ